MEHLRSSTFPNFHTNPAGEFQDLYPQMTCDVFTFHKVIILFHYQKIFWVEPSKELFNHPKNPWGTIFPNRSCIKLTSIVHRLLVNVCICSCSSLPWRPAILSVNLFYVWFGLIPLTPIAELCKLGQNVLSRVGQYDDIIPKLR